MNGWKISCQLDQSGTDQSQVRLVHTRQFSRLAPGAFNNCFPLFWLVPWLDCVDCVVIGPQIFTLPMWQFFTAFYWKLPGEVGEHYYFFFFANCQVTMFNIFQQYWTINILDDVKFGRALRMGYIITTRRPVVNRIIITLWASQENLPCINTEITGEGSELMRGFCCVICLFSHFLPNSLQPFLKVIYIGSRLVFLTLLFK